MRVDAFDFELPERLIALRPAEPRERARLLYVRPDAPDPFGDRTVADLPDLLRPGDLLVLNDTKVIPARLTGRRTGRDGSAPKIEVMLHKRLGPVTWACFARPARKLAAGDRLTFEGGGAALEADVEAKGEGGEVTLAFDCRLEDFEARLIQTGVMPLPPYIAGKRAPDEQDLTDYQTVFAREPGAVAAPTAGLHLTEALLDKIAEKGIDSVTVTLHVGAGTFLPVKAETTEDHVMHAEWGDVPEEAAARMNAARAAGGRIVACGTTALRLVESAAQPDGTVAPFRGDTAIFISPGYRFRAVDALITNFHLPRSTLFMLVAAFAGLEVMRRAYAHAIAERYRFYSYGDATLLFRTRMTA